jgi:hypothetical protein
MKLARSLLIGAAVALAAGCTDDKSKSSRAADNTDGKASSAEHRAQSPAKPTRSAANKPRPQNAGFDGLDKSGDGYLTRAEAKGNPHLASNFKAADRNKDGKLSRAEYRAMVTKSDVKTAKTRVALQRKPSAPGAENPVP